MSRKHSSAAVVREHLDRERRLFHQPIGPQSVRGVEPPRNPRPAALPRWGSKAKEAGT